MPLTRKQFVEKYYPDMVRITSGTNIFPSVMMAQAIVESQRSVGGYYYPGESLLSKVYNNYFGIKASSGWKGKTVNLVTGEVYNGVPVNVNVDFRVYDSPADSFADYVKFLKSNPRYANAGVFSAPTPQEQTKRLQAAGYATNPSYATLLNNVIDGFKEYIPNISQGGGMVALVILILILTR